MSASSKHKYKTDSRKEWRVHGFSSRSHGIPRRNWVKAETTVCSGNDSQSLVLRRDPTHPTEQSKSDKELIRDPVVDQEYGTREDKGSISRNLPSIDLFSSIVGIDKSSIQSQSRQSGWPDSLGWVDDQSTKNTCQTHSVTLIRESKDDTESKSRPSLTEEYRETHDQQSGEITDSRISHKDDGG